MGPASLATPSKYPRAMTRTTAPTWVQLQLTIETSTSTGPPPSDDPRTLIRTMAAMGYTDHAIARRLNADAVPTITGRGVWHHQQVTRVRDPAGWAAYMRAYRARRRAVT